MKILSISSNEGKVRCVCCKGTGLVDEGFGPEPCGACNGTGYE